jgi:hypothetical protein
VSKMKSRLKRLEAILIGSSRCPGCAGPITIHHKYNLPNGDKIVLPPYPVRPRCTCRRGEMKIMHVVICVPGQVSSREEAERDYAKHADHFQPWQPDAQRS